MSDKYIEKIYCFNFKGFRNQKIDGFNRGLNIFIGDNDTGKSSVLLAIDLVLSGNVNRVETIGLDKLINQAAVDEFLAKPNRKFQDLPNMEVDVYLNDQGRHELEGEGNVEQINAYGLALICRPRDDLFGLIQEVISLETPAFPYEYYGIEMRTFSGAPITPYKKLVTHLALDNTKISNDYATRSHVRSVYLANTDNREQNQLKYEYRNAKTQFSGEKFHELNERIKTDYQFSLKTGSKANLETDLTISRRGIDIEDLGVGSQCFIRTSFALSKKSNIDVVLLEEPENHLSHTNMRALIDEIKAATQSQLFIATHSSLICSRLNLRHAILFAEFDCDPIKLDDLPEDTAEFFMKAPSSGVLEYVLSRRSILVEGDAEFILMPEFYKNVRQRDLDSDSVHVISVGGISFPRYLDIAKLLSIRTAVITDNDGDPEGCQERYIDYDSNESISIHYDSNEERRTFEICVYRDNKDACDQLFASGRRTLTVEEYMLKNKASAAFQLALKKPDDLAVPSYIRDAIQWISS